MKFNLLSSSLVAIAAVLSLTAQGVQGQANSANWTQFANADCSGAIVATGTCSGDETCACEQIVGLGMSFATRGECEGFLSFDNDCSVGEGDTSFPGNTGCFSLNIDPA
ncbi:hypothetical protein BDP27DRAFT_1362187 [Rhodocollybia butyracea]|uniref:Extracellular membrane protein CFEM domain-containing protein n=1 Tax=Rhodocollybia butyracea TaxID=206335 RepID=A0A9P5U9F1_9AGAR|nr:hypothetical protein BDP27DRAFT_1362187 [Rhodocollybia butyracea]